MNEEEAKTRWCPFARVLVESDEARDHSRIASANRLEVPGAGGSDLGWRAANCIGGACMAWRGVSLPKGRAMTPQGEMVSTAAAKRFGWAVTTHGDGYCGLAGKPE